MPQHSPQDGHGPDVRSSFNLMYLLATIHVRCVTPFLRDQIGADANGKAGLLAFVAMFVYGGLMHEDRMLVYIVVWMLFMGIQRANSVMWRSRGLQIHSHYAGRPRIGMNWAKDPMKAKLVVEPLLCLSAGLILRFWSPVVAKLVASAGVSIIIVELIDWMIRSQREQAVIDARLESEALAEGVRKRIGY